MAKWLVTKPTQTVVQPVQQPLGHVQQSKDSALSVHVPLAKANQPQSEQIQSEHSPQIVRRSGRIAANPKPSAPAPEEPDEPSPCTHDPANVPKRKGNKNAAPANVPKPKGKKKKYMIKHFFTVTNCNRISQEYKLAVYNNNSKGIPAQTKAVKAVLYHNLDHPDSTLADKIRYHQYCGEDWCDFRIWEGSDKPLEDYKRTTKKDEKGKIVKWEGGFIKKWILIIQ